MGDLGEGIGEPFEMFEKEDMSDMFKRAMLEKMQLVGKSILPLSFYCQLIHKLQETIDAFIFHMVILSSQVPLHENCQVNIITFFFL